MQKGMVGMSAKVIIVSNGDSTAILLNDIFLKSAGRAAFTASGGLDADFSVDISLSTPNGILGETEFFEEAERILGYKLSREG